MKRLWKRRGDRELEARLRDGRPEPRPELTRSVADAVRARGHATTGSRRLSLGLAGGLSAIVLATVVALGGGTQALSAVGSQLSFQSAAKKPAAPARSQYGNRVTVCVLGRVQTRLGRRAAAELTRLGVAKLGPCARKPGRRRASLNRRPRRSICVLNQMQTKLYRPVARVMISLGVARSRRCSTFG